MCTGVRFSDDKGNMYFGRNLDWSCGYSQKVVVTPKGYKYNSAFLGEMAPKHGAIIGMADGKCEITVYTGGYSSATKTYYYSTYEDPSIRAFALENFETNASDLITVG